MHSPLTGAKKKIASAVCVLGIVALCLGVVGYQNKLKAEENLPVVTRGVVDKINQIPESKRNIYDKGATADKLGTKQNPLFILEIVPYEEYATFGYHISGCEPVDPKINYGHADAMELTNSIKTAKAIRQQGAHFFADEPESKPDAYDSDKVPVVDSNSMNKSYEGYYEMVEDGQGTFIQDASGKISKGTDADKDKRNIIWHTVCTTEKQNNKYTDETFKDASEYYDKLKKVGDRIYTKRISTSEDPAYVTYGYYYYKNNDNFIKYSILREKAGDPIDQDEVDNYCVIIKTITPKELNENPAWADYADLYFVSRSEYQGGTTANVWKKYNRLQHTSTTTSYTNSFVNTTTDKNRDISWPVVEKIFNKVTSDKNYAGMIMGSSLYTIGSYTGSTKPETDMQIYDWNLKKLYNETDNHYVTAKSGTKSNANMYKLALMLLSMDTDLFKDLYMNEDNPLIRDGEFLLRDGEDRTYWSQTTFLLMDSDAGVENFRNPYEYWTSDESWEKYGIAVELSSYRVWVKGHFYSFNDDNSITFDYTQAASQPNSKFKDYQDYLDEFYDKENAGGTPSDSVQYILNNRNTSENRITGKLNILDIEPCYDSVNGYSLQESYIRMMIPKFRGTINITHMTTAEFIGNNEDLNSTYNMIFMGLDDGAYNKAGDGKTVWNDSSMNGKIYFHTGDKMTAAEFSSDNRSRSVKFLTKGTKSGDNRKWKNVDSAELRFSGNDITRLKEEELKDFVKSGKPVVAVPYLYQRDKTRIDQYSNICDFVKSEIDQKNTGDNSVHFYQTNDVTGIRECMKQKKPEVLFTQTPKLYSSEEKTYLDIDRVGRSLLQFSFQADDPDRVDFRCNVYLDQNQDGKFSEDELYYEGEKFAADGSRKDVTCKLSRLYTGLIQWKIEVFCDENPSVRFTQTGCSAARNQTGQKKKINVLQILPKDGNFDGKLDLSTNPLFTKYYHTLDDYDITVTTETLDTFKKHFNADSFTTEKYQKVNSDPDFKTPDWMKVYRNYNMIIVGFGDTYGGVNIPNDHGEIDFLKFYISQGKSVLFTHDLTSMHNIKSDDFGYSANTYLRDTMGMNRYKAISRNLSERERKALAEKPDNAYDTVTDVTGKELDQKQGFTYYAMKRLGWKNSDSGTDWNILKNQKMPYRYLIKNPDGEEICGKSDLTKNTGFNNNNDLITKVSQMNQGQITQYPFKIDTMFTVSETHGQWYQLNMEDPEVTVWYCLADDKRAAAWQGTDNNGQGTGATYGVSPNDAANNYYIYSKGNVFYSGVGHSTITQEMEAKLFINTMIATYRASYVPPMVEVLNENTVITDLENLSYDMSFTKEYSEEQDESDWEAIGVDKEDPDFVKIIFAPEELNAISTKLDCSIYYKNESGDPVYVDTIYDCTTNEAIPTAEPETSEKNQTYKTVEDGKVIFKNVKNMKEYYFLYPKKYLSSWKEKKDDATEILHDAQREVVFQIKNNKKDEYGYTRLNMNGQMLFLLD